MRLYQLSERIGFRKTGLFPWFEPPAAGATMRYDGWIWDPAKREWKPTYVEDITIKYKPKADPKPTRPPGPAIPTIVEGWEWSEKEGEWLPLPMPTKTIGVGAPRPPEPTYYPAHPGVGEVLGWKFDFVGESWEPVGMPVTLVEKEVTRPPAPPYPPGPEVTMRVFGWYWHRGTGQWIKRIYAEEVIDFTPPRTLPPEVTEAMVLPNFPIEEQYLHFIEALIAQGLNRSDAVKIAQSMADGVLKEIYAKKAAISGPRWQQIGEAAAAREFDLLEKMTGVAILLALAAALGILIGSILERLVMPHEERVMLTPNVSTYLLGPGMWCYGRHIGTSAKGYLYYSCCDEIGTTYVRHMSRAGYSDSDVLDFPGGFVEKGWKWGKFVKYTWTQWNIEYVGFLVRVTDSLFMLKTRLLPPGPPYFPTFMERSDDWCIDFRYYL